MRSPSTVSPVGDARAGTGGEQDRVGLDLLDPFVGGGLDRVCADQAAGAPQQPHTLRLEQAGDASRSVSSMSLMRVRSAGTSRLPPASSPIVLRAREVGELVAGRDHRLARDAVVQVRGAADDVALDHRDLGAQRRRDRGRGVAGGAAADDHEAHGHVSRVRAGPRLA